MMTSSSDIAIPMINSLQQAKIILPNQKITDIMQGPNRAPEIYVGDAYDLKVDTWNYGVILYYLLAGTSHFPQID
jgi:serine/threonine protein kinase